MIKKNKKKQR